MTFSNGTPVDPTTLNDLQDSVVGMKMPSVTGWVAASTPNILGSGNAMTQGYIALSTSAMFQGMSLGRIFEGTRITAFSVMILGTALGKTVSFQLIRGTGTSLGTLSVTTTSTGWLAYPLAITPYVITPGDALFLSQTALANNAMGVGPVGLTIDRL